MLHIFSGLGAAEVQPVQLEVVQRRQLYPQLQQQPTKNWGMFNEDKKDKEKGNHIHMQWIKPVGALPYHLSVSNPWLETCLS